ncbi:MAG: zf-TFIIB domain-containing protein [Verrucomicrobiales bacterium]|nr:zf-TFIIB domain-containing protein [Verrucomicrobiales bacterium]MCP5525052.1 zf-TFIIB domain-containing protein [Verrucomicrobiales bacterium]
MRCPKCNTRELVATRVRGIEVDQCPACHGIWFDESELAALLQAEPSELKPLTRGRTDPGSDQQKGACPRDGRLLMRVHSTRNPRLVVDVCPGCRGLWLDGGELTALLQTR